MRNRAIRRFYKKQLLWHRRWFNGMPVSEMILFLSILVVILINYSFHL